MVSPYQNSGQGQYYGPPAGLAYLLAQRNRDTQAALGEIGQFAGAVGAGIGGYMQGRDNPGVFGEGVSPGQAGLRAGMMNFASAYDGGAGGSDTGFAGLKSGGAGGGKMNFKQLAELGKSADALRTAMVAGMPTAGDEEPNVFGTDEEWKTLGAQEKFNRVQAFVQGNAERGVMQRLAQVGLEMEQTRAGMAADTAFGQAMSTAQGRINNAALAEGNGPIRTRAPGFADFAAAASPDAWRSPMASAFVRSAAAGDTDDTGKQFERETARINAEANRKIAEARMQPKTGASSFNVRPVTDMFGNVKGYGVSAEFSTAEEAQAFVEKQQGGGGSTQNQEDAELKLAREAIAGGADPKKVAKRYKERTGKEWPQ